MRAVCSTLLKLLIQKAVNDISSRQAPNRHKTNNPINQVRDQKLLEDPMEIWIRAPAYFDVTYSDENY